MEVKLETVLFPDNSENRPGVVGGGSSMISPIDTVLVDGVSRVI